MDGSFITEFIQWVVLTDDQQGFAKLLIGFLQCLYNITLKLHSKSKVLQSACKPKMDPRNVHLCQWTAVSQRTMLLFGTTLYEQHHKKYAYAKSKGADQLLIPTG